MSILNDNQTVNQAFFQPLKLQLDQAIHTAACKNFPDEQFLMMGVQRVMECCQSGRAFLQEHGIRFEQVPGHSNYYVSLKNTRRRDMLREVNEGLIQQANPILHDRLASIPELDLYECFAVDGHWHKAAAHDPKHNGAKMAVGHFYSLNLRTHTLRHLAAAEGLHEHDMSALKRVKPKGLRQDVPKGKRALCIYDKAGIDLNYWKRCRQEKAVYFISRIKENMVYDWLDNRELDRSDPRNHGIESDQRIKSRDGHRLRLIVYTDPITQRRFEFLTNEMDLPAAVIVELYRRRWEVEKVYDEIKNKLWERKAWASGLIAKENQALMVVLTHNLLLLYEQSLEQSHGISNEAEDRRRQQRMNEAIATCQKAGQSISTLVTSAKRATQRSVKFIRWVRQSIRDRSAEATAVLRLRQLYATL